MSRQRRLPSARGLQQESVLLAGGLRAILLQLAHPAVGHGVAEHSDFAADPMRRLFGTLDFVYVVADGDPALVRRVADRVGRLHAPVVSASGEQPAYDAGAADQQRWVAATIHDTASRITRAVWGPLPAALAKEQLAADGDLATVLGLPVEQWPRTDADFRRFSDGQLGALGFDEVTLRPVAALFAARRAAPWVRAAMPFLVAGTLPTLPPALRQQLAPLAPRWAPDLRRPLLRLAPLYRALPPRLRRLPARRVVARVRARS